VVIFRRAKRFLDGRGGRDSPLDAEKDLLQSVARGDPAALGRLDDRLGADAYRLASAVTCDVRRSEQVVEDVFLDLWRSPKRFERGRSVRGPLLAGVLVRSLSSSRRQASPRGGPPPAAPAALLAGLPEDERTAITLASLGRLTADEIAEALELPRGTVMQLLSAGVKRLASVTSQASRDGSASIEADPRLG
jgi:DNA-directed RNA polymerase specialized sigma24 family protein